MEKETKTKLLISFIFSLAIAGVNFLYWQSISVNKGSYPHPIYGFVFWMILLLIILFFPIEKFRRKKN